MTVCMCSSSPSAPWVRLQAVSAAGAVYGVEVLAARHMRVAAFSWQSCCSGTRSHHTAVRQGGLSCRSRPAHASVVM